MRKPDELRAHIEQVRRVRPDFDIPEMDPWAPETIDALRELRSSGGRFSGRIGRWRFRYYAGRGLPVEADILEADTGRRVGQDGSRDRGILDRLKRRFDAG